MENISLVIMEKETDTGYLGKELGSYELKFDAEYVGRIFAHRENGELIAYMYITIPGEFQDWEFNAILDNYNPDLYEGKAISINEDDDSYNPSWIVKFNFLENDDKMEEKINEILGIHSMEINRVLQDIKGLESEYKE